MCASSHYYAKYWNVTIYEYLISMEFNLVDNFFSKWVLVRESKKNTNKVEKIHCAKK